MANAMIAFVPFHRSIDHTPIKRFQKAMKCGTKERHGRPQNRVWRLDFESKAQALSAVQRHATKKSRTAVRLRGYDD
jgi:hypothetical protein